MTRSTEIAMATEQRRVNRNSGTDSQFGRFGANSLWDVAAHSNYLASELMTGHDRIRRRRKFTLRNMQVSSANTTGSHSNDQFAWLRHWIGDIADPHTSRLIDDSSTHGYTSLNKLTLLRLDNRLSYFNNAQLRSPTIQTGLPIGQDLCLDTLALANHVQRVGKVLKRQSCGEHCFGVYHPTADEIESRPKGEQDRHRAKHSDLIIVDAERGERHSGFLRCHAKDHKLTTALDRCESAFHGPGHTRDVDDTIKAERLVLKQLIDIRLDVGGTEFGCAFQALGIEVHHGHPRGSPT